MTVVIAIGLFTGLGFVIDDITEKNTILSTESKQILFDFQSEVNTNLNSDLIKPVTADPNVTAGSGEEDFSREFRESVAVSDDKGSSIEVVSNVPAVFLKSSGLQQDDQVTFYMAIIGFTLTFLIGLALYIAWKTGEVKNR